MEISGIAYRSLRFAVIVSILIVTVGLICGDNVVAGDGIRMDLEQVSAEKWNELEKKRIFFGHHSVGHNILNGVDIVKSRLPAIKLNVVKLDGADDLILNGKGMLIHGGVGKNCDPRSKIDDFAHWLDRGIGKKIDVAFMKFCFVDIGSQTDLELLFGHYKKTMAELKTKYPAITIVHFTVPLLSEPTGFARWKHKLKGVVKQIMGKNEFYENINKFVFNEMIRAEYNGKEPVFDLAAIESTFPDGSRSTFSAAGKDVESMVAEYTNDGGHLSLLGKEIVAENMLFFLANLD